MHRWGWTSRDGEIDELLRALDALPGPVWLTLHHEPEGVELEPRV
ncbi:hypothetical protein [Archangium lansingense]|uniref:Uncharacterized protein n=1 Tax=Archangium lansingense TaxID=2995310 RepID=A0ABT4AB36_9BACT|nr:hypothetical protein [Archangium lansinium]MCY1078888.1 hypothetical protein [Archangium lansinium]